METVAIQVELQAAQILVQVVGQLIESNTSSATVKLAVDAVEKWTPILVGAFPQLASQFEEFVSILMGNDDLTDDQLTQLTNTRAALENARKAANDAATAAGEGSAT